MLNCGLTLAAKPLFIRGDCCKKDIKLDEIEKIETDLIVKMSSE